MYSEIMDDAQPDDNIDVVAVVNAPQFKPTPEPDKLCKKWKSRIENAKKHYNKYFERVKHNRKLVQGFNLDADPDDERWNKLRANLIQGTITAMLPNIYAKNPEIAVIANYQEDELKLFTKTVEKVVNRYLDDANLKTKAKSTVRSAMTCSIGCVKVTYQQDIRRDPIIQRRIQDSQDNLLRVEQLLMELQDDEARQEQELVKEELEQTIAALEKQVETVKSEGIVIDRVMTENIIVDPLVAEFWDYREADWICQIIPMKKDVAEGMFGYKLDKAKRYNEKEFNETWIPSGNKEPLKDEDQVVIYEVWDKSSERVYTFAEGCEWWLKEPYSPEAVGERWYPFFLLPYQTVDGTFFGPSLVDLLEKLQDEHNKTRDKFNDHRDLIKPGWITASSISQKDIKNFIVSELGEVTMLDGDGQNVQQLIMPKQHPPIDPQVYDVSGVRYDWEQVSGMQDAARSTIVQAKTATEANIMQQSLSGRVAEFRDQVEDFLQDIAQYTAEILLLTISDEQVAKICGQNQMGLQLDPMTGLQTPVIVKQNYQWNLSQWQGISEEERREEVFNLIEIRIRAGSTGAPNKQEERETWLQMIQVIQPLIGQIIQLQMNGADYSVFENLLKETIARFDDSLDVDEFVPKITQQQIQQMQMQQLAQAAQNQSQQQ